MNYTMREVHKLGLLTHKNQKPIKSLITIWKACQLLNLPKHGKSYLISEKSLKLLQKTIWKQTARTNSKRSTTGKTASKETQQET